jgi:hypothetical protein
MQPLLLAVALRILRNPLRIDPKAPTPRRRRR